MVESIFLATIGCLIGIINVALILTLLKPLLITQYGLFISANFFNTYMLMIVGLIIFVAAILGLIPSIVAYKCSLKDGLNIKA